MVFETSNCNEHPLASLKLNKGILMFSFKLYKNTPFVSSLDCLKQNDDQKRRSFSTSDIVNTVVEIGEFQIMR